MSENAPKPEVILAQKFMLDESKWTLVSDPTIEKAPTLHHDSLIEAGRQKSGFQINRPFYVASLDLLDPAVKETNIAMAEAMAGIIKKTNNGRFNEDCFQRKISTEGVLFTYLYIAKDAMDKVRAQLKGAGIAEAVGRAREKLEPGTTPAAPGFRDTKNRA